MDNGTNSFSIVLDSVMAEGENTGAEQEKIVFNDAQQAHIQKILDDRFSKISSKHQDELKALQDQLATAQAEVAKLSEAGGKPGKNGKEGDEQQKQWQGLLDNEKAQTKAAKELLATKTSENDNLQATIMQIQKETAITNAAGSRFLSMEAVKAMTAGQIEWDADSKAFVVRENGIIRQNSSLQNMTLEEFYEDFGRKHPYLVRSDVRSGAGSSENNRGGAAALGKVNSRADLKTTKDKVEYVKKFGQAAFEALPIR